MPYLIVVEMDVPRDVALEFANALNTGPLESDVRGVYRVPTQFCDCASNNREHMKSWSRGKKFGWWIHADCGKPSPHWASGLGVRITSVLGRNLLGDKAPENWRGEEPLTRDSLIAQQEVKGSKYQLPGRKRDAN